MSRVVLAGHKGAALLFRHHVAGRRILGGLYLLGRLRRRATDDEKRDQREEGSSQGFSHEAPVNAGFWILSIMKSFFLICPQPRTRALPSVIE